MPQSLSRVLVHLVFSTKGREPMIPTPLLPELHAYLAATLRASDCPPLQVGGIEDHVHLLFSLSRTRTMADLVEALKTGSSRWMKARGGIAAFRWQTGYGAFSVSPAAVPRTVEYLRRQREHHARRSYADELRLILRRHGVSFDERYLWDEPGSLSRPSGAADVGIRTRGSARAGESRAFGASTRAGDQTPVERADPEGPEPFRPPRQSNRAEGLRSPSTGMRPHGNGRRIPRSRPEGPTSPSQGRSPWIRPHSAARPERPR